MPTDDVRILLFSIFFGAVMGWGFSREGDDVKHPGRVAMAVTLAIGLVAWVSALALDTPPDGLLAMAAVSLTGGTAAGLVVLQVLQAKG